MQTMPEFTKKGACRPTKDSGQNSHLPKNRDSVDRAASGPLSRTPLPFHFILLSVYFAFQINFLMFLINLELN